MAYTEIKERKKKKYYYRVLSIREGKKVSKRRKYLGVNLSLKELSLKEKTGDKELGLINKAKRERNLEKIKPEIIRILKNNNVKKAGIFGSYSRGESKKGSDIDIIIQPPKNIGFSFAGIELELEKELSKKVDLITYNSIHPLLKKRILNEEVRIL